MSQNRDGAANGTIIESSYTKPIPPMADCNLNEELEWMVDEVTT